MLPASLKEIKEEAFIGCLAQVIDLRNSEVVAIGDRAFKNCYMLERIYIPDTVKSFGADIFEGCDKVVIVCNEDSAASNYARDNGIKASNN